MIGTVFVAVSPVTLIVTWTWSGLRSAGPISLPSWSTATSGTSWSTSIADGWMSTCARAAATRRTTESGPETLTDVAATVPLALPDGVDAIDGSDVRVTVRIRAVRGTRTYGIGIRLTGARGDRTYTLSTPQVTATIGGPVPVLDALDASTLVAVADVTGLSVGEHNVKLAFRAPAGTALVAFTPATIVVTVAAPTPAPTATPQPTPGPSGP